MRAEDVSVHIRSCQTVDCVGMVPRLEHMFCSDPLRATGSPASVAREHDASYAAHRTSAVVNAVNAHLARSLDELDETAIRAEMA
ncbi:MAG: hypothetical protein KY457_09165, partial [Actinobacteria bacterium]|nr:hypothetical protein [Actinomycetota bacterium]